MRSAAAIAAFLGLVLALVLVQRISSEALALVIGVLCGLAAGMPTFILLLFALRWRGRRGQPRAPGPEQRDYPPVVVLQGDPRPGLPGGGWAAPPPGPVEHRRVRLVGGDDLGQDEEGAGGNPPAPAS